jgi:hypothetical protein
MSNIHPDLARWLDTATEGLSSEVAAAVRDELTAHYEDALAEYTEQGAADAHARAMADLGAADTTAQGLKDAHLGRRRYEMASVASLLTVITIFVVNFAYVLCVGKGPQAKMILLLVFNLVMLPLSLWVLLTLKRLLTWRFGVPRLDRIFALGIGGLVANCIVDSVSQAVFGYSFNSGGVRSVLDLTGGFEIAVNLAHAAGGDARRGDFDHGDADSLPALAAGDAAVLPGGVSPLASTGALCIGKQRARDRQALLPWGAFLG